MSWETAYQAAVSHDLIRQTGLSDNADAGDPYGTLMHIGFIICDALTIRGEHVPGSMGYRPNAGLPTSDELGNLDAEQAEDAYPDYGDLYFAWGLGLGDNVMGGWYADAIRDYLTDVWEPAHAAVVAAGRSY